jgi:hypothetical protein
MLKNFNCKFIFVLILIIINFGYIVAIDCVVDYQSQQIEALQDVVFEIAKVMEELWGNK